MQLWEYAEVDFDGKTARAWYYDEAGAYIDAFLVHARLGILLATLGHDGWEMISVFWRSRTEVTYMLKRPYQGEWTPMQRQEAQDNYHKAQPKDKRF